MFGVPPRELQVKPIKALVPDSLTGFFSRSKSAARRSLLWFGNDHPRRADHGRCLRGNRASRDDCSSEILLVPRPPLGEGHDCLPLTEGPRKTSPSQRW